MIRSDFTDTLVADYTDFNLNTIRIFDNYVYLAGTYTGSGVTGIKNGIWRNQILTANGSLGTIEDIFNLEAYYKTDAGVPEIRTITFAEDGFLYIGQDSTMISNAVTEVSPDAGGLYPVSNASALYQVLIVPPATTFCWGNDQFLYLNRRSNSNNDKVLLRLTMGKFSAPYYGRQ
jgi:hypothetical protein